MSTDIGIFWVDGRNMMVFGWAALTAVGNFQHHRMVDGHGQSAADPCVGIDCFAIHLCCLVAACKHDCSGGDFMLIPVIQRVEDVNEIA